MTFATARTTFTALALLALFACGGSSEIDVQQGQPQPQPQPKTEVENPNTNLKVKVALASASIGPIGGANFQLAFFAPSAAAPATVAVKKVLLLDGTDGSEVDVLTATTPQVWNGRSYESWNQQVTPGGDLKASYTLTQPAWSKIDRNTPTRSTPFKLRVTLEIDGQAVVLESGELHREEAIPT